MIRYYELTSGNVVTSKQLYLVYEIITGKKFPSDIEFDMLDDMLNLKGIKQEIENPTPILLLQMNQYELAIELYMELKDCDYNTAVAQIENIKKKLNISDGKPLEINLEENENDGEYDEDSDITNTFESIINSEEQIDNEFDADDEIPAPKTAYEAFLREYEAQNPPILTTEQKPQRTSIDPSIIKARQERAISRDAEKQARKARREKEKEERLKRLQMQASFLD